MDRFRLNCYLISSLRVECRSFIQIPLVICSSSSSFIFSFLPKEVHGETNLRIHDGGSQLSNVLLKLSFQISQRHPGTTMRFILTKENAERSQASRFCPSRTNRTFQDFRTFGVFSHFLGLHTFLGFRQV